MSKDIIVLTPNGRRQKVHCTPDTNILQVLEDVCKKQGFQPSDYNLKHHNHVLDLTTTIRFSNLPNKAFLEMVEAERKREEFNVTIGLTLEDGERRTGDFVPTVSLFDIVTLLAPTELESIQNPTILYMRQEIVGVRALRDKTLRQLGLIGGRAILRLINKAEEQVQANVSSVYRAKPVPDKESNYNKHKQVAADPKPEVEIPIDAPSTSQQKETMEENRPRLVKPLNPIDQIKKEKLGLESESNKNKNNDNKQEICQKSDEPMDVDLHTEDAKSSSLSIPKNSMNPASLERRLRIEEEVTFLGSQKAVAFTQPENQDEELEDLPDDFYDLSIEEVRRLYHDLQQQRLQLENTPLLTSNKREQLQTQESGQNVYKNAVVRVQFPDHIILQGVFLPTNTIEDITEFIKEHLQNPEREFQVYTTPLKETLNPKTTLLDAKFVPCVHMHFKWLSEDKSGPCLKSELYSQQTSSDAASILASKYRAPSRRKMDEPSTSRNAASTSQSSKLPKWFKK